VSDDAVTRPQPRQDAAAPVDEANAQRRADMEEEMPRVHLTRRHALAFGLFILSALAFLYFVLPKITGLSKTWDRLNHGQPGWLVVAALLEGLSFAGYVMLFRTVFIRGDTEIDWRESYQITMAGLAATRLFAAAGAGGIALTAWALRRSGMERRLVACRLVAFMVLLYFVYMAALVVDGIGLWTGLFPGGGSFAITVVPAIFGGTVILIGLAISLIPSDLERRLLQAAQGDRRLRLARLASRVASVPATLASGVRTAISLARARQVGLLGALVWWGFDIAVLWACFHAFGANPPPLATIVMAYYVGTLANTLPLPGGIGGVEGGMIGAFLAFGVSDGLAVVTVLTYRAFSFWLPTIPGAIAYWQLRRTVARWRAARTQASLAA
jgi:uncharacterized protein (TIRG00374 family)